jgi:Flp pilus assembly protein TadG
VFKGYGRVQRFWKNQAGATLVWVSLMMVGMLAMLALALDGGYAYSQRREMQNAADASAIAGGRIMGLGGNTSQIETAVSQYASANGADTYSWTIINGGNTIQVSVSRTFATFFANIVGIQQYTASAQAEASLSYLAGTGNLLPIITFLPEDCDGFNDDDGGNGKDKGKKDDGGGDDDENECEPFAIGYLYNLWDKDDKNAPGNFGWLDWNGGSPNTPELANNIANPSNSGYWEVGNWVPSGPGAKASSQVQNALNNWIGQHVTIPLYDQVTGTGNNTMYCITAFAEFILTDYNFNGNDKYVSGYFIQWVESGRGGGPPRGVRTPVLTR